MMRIEHMEYLIGLGLVPIGLLLFVWAWRKRKQLIARLGDKSLVQQLIPEQSNKRYLLKFLLTAMALVLLVVGLANPQIGSKKEKVKRKGVDVVIALDLSKSMLAEDIKPNRLDRSKVFISSLIDKFQNDKLGLVIFAGNAYLQMPLTIDYSASEMYLRSLHTNVIPTQGTAISDAIKLAENAFEAGQKKHKVLIIVSDGENHDEEAIKMAKIAAENGTIVHTVGVGTSDGAPIPEIASNGKVNYKKDNNGSIVLSKLNEKTLQQIAVSGNGSYFRLAAGRESVNAIMKQISEMETKEIDELVYTDYKDQFQYFLFFGLILLLIEFFISAKKRGIFSKIELFKDAK